MERTQNNPGTKSRRLEQGETGWEVRLGVNWAKP